MTTIDRLSWCCCWCWSWEVHSLFFSGLIRLWSVCFQLVNKKKRSKPRRKRENEDVHEFSERKRKWKSVWEREKRDDRSTTQHLEIFTLAWIESVGAVNWTGIEKKNTWINFGRLRRGPVDFRALEGASERWGFQKERSLAAWLVPGSAQLSSARLGSVRIGLAKETKAKQNTAEQIEETNFSLFMHSLLTFLEETRRKRERENEKTTTSTESHARWRRNNKKLKKKKKQTSAIFLLKSIRTDS